jgi:hypothetical protein
MAVATSSGWSLVSLASDDGAHAAGYCGEGDCLNPLAEQQALAFAGARNSSGSGAFRPVNGVWVVPARLARTRHHQEPRRRPKPFCRCISWSEHVWYQDHESRL